MKIKEKRTKAGFTKRVKDEEQKQEKVDYNSIKIALYEELKALRQNPKSYIPLIEQQMRLIKKNNNQICKKS